MEIAGKLIQKLDQQSGQGRNGTWVKQEFILETQDQYPRKVCIALWGDKVKDIDNLNIGDTLKAMINVESREFNGRWYTDVKAWRIEPMGAAQAGSPSAPEAPSFDELPPEMPMTEEGEMDDLPF
ncbi:MAG TPA: DUF3127 domain-containing protein [Tenuifilaceae bacterium]|nr:DUF3127 domain-containing protein [Tenuifilaceae bacterium]